MIGISTELFDLEGSINFQTVSADSQLDDISRRVSRRATLDGKAELTDSGYSVADRDFIIILKNIKKPDAEKLKYIFKNYTIVHLSTHEGFFKVAAESLTKSNSEMSLRFLVLELLSS